MDCRQEQRTLSFGFFFSISPDEGLDSVFKASRRILHHTVQLWLLQHSLRQGLKFEGFAEGFGQPWRRDCPGAALGGFGRCLEFVSALQRRLW